MNRKAKLEHLLYECNEAYYWMGFIMADGSINYKNHRLTVGINIKDKDHLQKLADFIEYGVPIRHNYATNSVILAAQNTSVVPKLVHKFKLQQDKTRNPPYNLSFNKEDKFVSFLLGFIDGDGCVKKQYGRDSCRISIKLHRSWKRVLQSWINKIYKINNVDKIPRAKINSSGYVEVCIGKEKVIHSLKNKGIELRLPILDRKWDKISGTPSVRHEKAYSTRQHIIALSKQCYSQQYISVIVGVSKSWVSRVLKDERNSA